MWNKLDNNLVRGSWFETTIWMLTSLTFLTVTTIMDVIMFGTYSFHTWILLVLIIVTQALAVLNINGNRTLGLVSLFMFNCLILNYFGMHSHVESGLVFLYPMLATCAIITIRDKKIAIPVFGVGFVSFLIYPFARVEEPASMLKEYYGEIDFVLTMISVVVCLILFFLYSRKWKAREQHVSDRYKRLSAFVRFVNESPLPLLRVDEKGEVLLINASAKRLLQFNDHAGLNYPPGVSQAIIDSLRSNETIELQSSAAGRTIQFTITPNKSMKYVNIYGEDITELYCANERLNNLNNAINLSADGIAIIDRNGQLEHMNSSFFKILGFKSQDNMKLKAWKDLFEDSWYRENEEEVTEKLKWEHVWRGEAQSLTAEGDTLNTYLTLTRIPGHRMICYLRDNTQVKKYQDQLIVARDKAQAATSAKSDFLATMSHEIRTPMNGVLGTATLMAGTKLDEIQSEYLDTILTSGENLMAIINEILDFSKIEAGKMELEELKISSKKLIHNSMKLASHRASVRNNTLTSKVDASVPRFFLADRGRVSQVLNNLLSNAIKFTRNGRVDLFMTAKPTDVEREFEICVAITDTGIGIAQDKIPILFDPFTQADTSTTRKYGGTGLGLAICKNIAMLMGGGITVESEEGMGSTFYFKFTTIAIPGEDHEENEAEVFLPDPEMGANYPLKILLAEDNFINQKLAEQVFSLMGYDIKIVENGQLAVEACQREEYDIVFMDVHMPELDGIQATKEIHKILENPPYVVALTANVVSESRRTCLDAGMVDFIQKPFKPTDIERLIRWVSKELKAQESES